MSKYQITLTPVDKYFFGGDMTFNVRSQDKDFNEQYGSYIIHSSYFPQQTSLLGMMRFLILRNAGDDVFKDGKIVDKEKAKSLIGARSFIVNPNHEGNLFGMIKKLSHVRIRMTVDGCEKELEYAPFYRKPLNLEITSNDKGIYNMHDVFVPTIDDYKAKEGLDDYLTDGAVNYTLRQLFKEDRRIGIARDIVTGKTGEKDDKALFKQISYRFADRLKANEKDEGKAMRCCFVFGIEVDDNLALEQYNGQLVTVGGDNSQFVIGITKEMKNSITVQLPNQAVCLLSPTYLQRNEAQRAAFAITKLIPFRFLMSEMDKAQSYHILSKELTRSNKYELYAPGSVFYFKDEAQKQEFISSIEAKKEFRQIGYNAYK